MVVDGTLFDRKVKRKVIAALAAARIEDISGRDNEYPRISINFLHNNDPRYPFKDVF